jgi:hypothetical protein
MEGFWLNIAEFHARFKIGRNGVAVSCPSEIFSAAPWSFFVFLQSKMQVLHATITFYAIEQIKILSLQSIYTRQGFHSSCLSDTSSMHGSEYPAVVVLRRGFAFAPTMLHTWLFTAFEVTDSWSLEKPTRPGWDGPYRTSTVSAYRLMADDVNIPGGIFGRLGTA